MSDYEHIHATFDAFEMPVSLHCVRCHAVIATRGEIPSKRFPGTAMMGIVKAPNYRETRVELSDGSISYVPQCTECVKLPMDLEKTIDVIKRTWEEEMRHLGRPEEAIQEMKERRASLSIIDKGAKDGR